MRRWVGAVVVGGAAWVMCASALAEEPLEASARQAQWRRAFASAEAAPLDDERLANLRGQRAAPADLTQAGVVLWDESRKGLPPVRNSSGAGNVSVTSSFTIHFK